MRRRHSQRGITLIELMVVVALIGILAAIAAQFGSGWTNNAKVAQTQAALQHAYSAAKSASLQNPAAVTGDSAAATLCLRTGQLAVVVGGDCKATAFWTETLPSNTIVRLGADSKVTCVSLTNAGLPVATTSCTTSPAYSVVAGENRVEKNLY